MSEFSTAQRSSAFRQLAALAIATVFTLTTVGAPLASGSRDFVSSLWPEAEARGVSRAVFEASLGNFTPSDKVMELTRKQPEFTQTVGDYVGKRVTAQQVARGRTMAGEWRKTLAKISGQSGVQPEIVLAIWGMETNFGSFMGGNNTIHALATLTYGGYRSSYFKNELLTALQIASSGHVHPRDMVGSWAGAMGHTQFMPTSFVKYAVDFDRDGRADIWNNVPDALASTGNYLDKHGWRPGETWGYEVKLPRDFNYLDARNIERASLRDWASMGVVRTNGREFPRPGDMARLYLPTGGKGPAFLLLPNFEVIKRYNNSDSYALAVGHLADRIIGGGEFAVSWPDDTALNEAQRRELQQQLSRRGYAIGAADGVIGPKTRAAIADWQRRNGEIADGHAGGRLLQALR
jgi:membrane-bound lytic murein transglycosylase B